MRKEGNSGIQIQNEKVLFKIADCQRVDKSQPIKASNYHKQIIYKQTEATKTKDSITRIWY